MTPQPPRSRGFTALLCATAGAYTADQLALAAIPLAAVLLLGASAREVGLLVAMHSAAWLVISMPAGILVDQVGRRRMASLTQALAAAALALATIAAMQGWDAGLGAAIFVAAGGSVTFMLAAIAVIPSLVASPHFARANASIELVRGSVAIAAPLLLLSARTGGGIAPALTYLLLSFAPMLWFICQTTLRQTITPRALLGRVSATIQVAIYGVRPIGALVGGALADFAGLDTAVMLVIAAFTASALVAWLSPLGRLRVMPDAV